MFPCRLIYVLLCRLWLVWGSIHQSWGLYKLQCVCWPRLFRQGLLPIAMSAGIHSHVPFAPCLLLYCVPVCRYLRHQPRDICCLVCLMGWRRKVVEGFRWAGLFKSRWHQAPVHVCFGSVKRWLQLGYCDRPFNLQVLLQPGSVFSSPCCQVSVRRPVLAVMTLQSL